MLSESLKHKTIGKCPLVKQFLLFYVYDMPAAPTETVRASFSFYQKDLDSLVAHVGRLGEQGIKTRRATLLKALIHYTPAKQMHVAAVKLSAEQSKTQGPRETEYIADYPTVDLTAADLQKLDDVVTDLAKESHLSSRVFVVRAMIRSLPENADLVPMMKRFKKEFPDKPRGWAARKLKEGKGG